MEIQEMVEKLGYSALNPMQQGAIGAGLLTERHFLASCPTASGKTLLALLRIAANCGNGKAVYIVPLRALASEKKDEFEKALAPFGLSVGISIGDYDSASEELAAYDVIVATSEKMDSLLRHKSPWLKSISLVIADEIHMINDDRRGATLEVVLTKLKEGGAAVVGLSATIPNAGEMAKWLGAAMFESDYRPTKLDKMIASEGKIHSEDGVEEIDEKRQMEALIAKALAENGGKGQAIVFVSTRRSTESVAEDLAKVVAKKLTEDERNECMMLARKALHALAQPTRQCESLAKSLEGGVAFHHAGLVDKDRKLIERGFKHDRCVKVIVATTTLAMGVDFPASWVIVRDNKRFDDGYSAFIPNLEMQQMCGRAGRPRFDKRGVAVICCAKRDLRQVRDKYILGPLENIFSKLSSEPALRSHTLALVASDECRSFGELQSFFGKTFFAHQYGSGEELFGLIERIGMQLVEWDFMREKGGRLIPTPVGKRVSELYIDPLTAASMIDFIKARSKAIVKPAGKTPLIGPDFAMLFECSNAMESKPLPRVGRGEEQLLWDEAFAALDDFTLEKWEFDRDALGKWKNAKIANAWVNEEGENAVMEKYDLPPGVLHARMRILQWLVYCIGEIAYIMNASGARLESRKLERRIRHGVKEELLDLVRLRGVGRMRARLLFSHGIRDRNAVAAAGTDRISAILGRKVAERALGRLAPQQDERQ